MQVMCCRGVGIKLGSWSNPQRQKKPVYTLVQLQTRFQIRLGMASCTQAVWTFWKTDVALQRPPLRASATGSLWGE